MWLVCLISKQWHWITLVLHRNLTNGVKGFSFRKRGYVGFAKSFWMISLSKCGSCVWLVNIVVGLCWICISIRLTEWKGLSFRKGIAADRLIGFQDLGGKDDFTTKVLENLLIKKGMYFLYCVCSTYLMKPSLIHCFAGIISEKKQDVDDEDDENHENRCRTVRSSVHSGSDSDWKQHLSYQTPSFCDCINIFVATLYFFTNETKRLDPWALRKTNEPFELSRVKVLIANFICVNYVLARLTNAVGIFITGFFLKKIYFMFFSFQWEFYVFYLSRTSAC